MRNEILCWNGVCIKIWWNKLSLYLCTNDLSYCAADKTNSNLNIWHHSHRSWAFNQLCTCRAGYQRSCKWSSGWWYYGQSNFGDDCDLMMISQLVTSGIHKTSCSDSDSVNDGDKQRTVTHVKQDVGTRGLSMKFVWHDISTLSIAWKTFRCLQDPQFNTSNLDVVNIFEH